MSTLRQKSFLATMTLNGESLVIRPWFNIDRLNITKRNETAVILYFRCEGDFYNIYVRSEGNHFGKNLDVSDPYVIANSAKATGFKILNPDGKTLTLDDLSSNNEKIQLHTRNGTRLYLDDDWSGTGDFPLRVSPAYYRAFEDPLIYSLNILERNTPYLGFPDEI
jgi:hypothetical protein